MPTWSSSASASSRLWSAARRHIENSLWSCESSAICTFSTTVSEAKVSAIWKVRPTPLRQISRGFRPPRSAPSSGVGAVEGDGAVVGLELAVDHVEGGRLAGAVGADEREQFAGRQLEADAVHGLHAAEGFAEVGDFEEAHAFTSLSLASASSCFGARQRSTSCLIDPAMPCGNSSTRIRMMAPSIARQ